MTAPADRTEAARVAALIELMAAARTDAEREACVWLSRRRPLMHKNQLACWWLSDSHPNFREWARWNNKPMGPKAQARWSGAALPDALFRRLRLMPGSDRVDRRGGRSHAVWFHGSVPWRAVYGLVLRAWYRSPRFHQKLLAWEPPDPGATPAPR